MAPAAIRSRALVLGGLLGLGAAKVHMQGVSYGVSPGTSELPANDDFFSDESAAQWDVSGRGDLVLMRAMGANAVRLYGNDPRLQHGKFLDAAHKLGMQVIPGNSDWPFMQAPNNCKSTSNYDCSQQVKESYAQNLQRGFLRQDGTYHPALGYIVAMNEPDMKVPDVSQPKEFCKAIISAIDGMLEAEKEAKVTGALPNITVTFSWSLCSTCDKFTDKPGLGQMYQLRDAMMDPSKYGYAAVNDLAEVYRTRFVYSYNTANPSFHMRPLFLDFYEPEFPQTPVFIAEYHWNNPKGNQQEDLEKMNKVIAASPLLLGISFFEFQLRTDLGGHKEFGMLRLGSGEVATMSYFGKEYSIRCLEPVVDETGNSLPAQVAAAFKGMPEVFKANTCLTGKNVRLPRTTTTRTRAATTAAAGTTTPSATAEAATTTAEAEEPEEEPTTTHKRLRRRTTTYEPDDTSAARGCAAGIWVALLASAVAAALAA